MNGYLTLSDNRYIRPIAWTFQLPQMKQHTNNFKMVLPDFYIMFERCNMGNCNERSNLRFSLDWLQFRHIIRRYVSLLLGRFWSCKPPVPLRIVQNFQVLPFLEAQIFVSSRIVVVQGDENFGIGTRGTVRIGRHGGQAGTTAAYRVLVVPQDGHRGI